jgi:hypothetical protein
MLAWIRNTQRLSRQLLVALFLFLYIFMGIAASLHHHSQAYSEPSQSHSSVIDAADCPLCEFTATLNAPAPQAPALPDLAPVLTDIPAPTEHSCPFFPRRFCDRSAARAPPALPTTA